MDIRIGNDIRLNVALSDFNILDTETIKRAQCFLMSGTEKDMPNVDPKSIVLPTKYTLRNCGGRIYNVQPSNAQVRPCDGPEFFDLHIRQYGNPIFTSFSNRDGYIYGYFQERAQHLLDDYYLVVMLVLDRKKYGVHNERHIVIDYGYQFTLTLDGNTVDPDGIYVSNNNTIIEAQFVDPDILQVDGKPVSVQGDTMVFTTSNSTVSFNDSNLTFNI